MELTRQSKFQAGESVNCAIILKSIQELIGAIGLIIDKRFNRAELGYWIAKEYWNQGYCTEASKAILKYGFMNWTYTELLPPTLFATLSLEK